MTDKTTPDDKKLTPTPNPAWTVIAADGTLVGSPTADDHLLLSRAQSLLADDDDFRALRESILSRIELNLGVPSTQSGHLCLRYEAQGATPQEFWPHWGHQDHVGFRSGQISVKQEPAG